MGFLKMMGDPVSFKSWSNDLDDFFGYPHDFGNLQIRVLANAKGPRLLRYWLDV